MPLPDDNLKRTVPMFDPMDFVKEVPPRRGADRRFEVDADKCYPAVVAAIKEGMQCSTPDAIKYNPLIQRARKQQQGLEDALAEVVEVEREGEQEVILGGETIMGEDGPMTVGGRREKRLVKIKIPQLPCEQLPAERLLGRALILEIARKWFTNELRCAAEGSIEVYWSNSPRWRLGVSTQALDEMEAKHL